jgi:hypothetical protein
MPFSSGEYEPLVPVGAATHRISLPPRHYRAKSRKKAHANGALGREEKSPLSFWVQGRLARACHTESMVRCFQAGLLACLLLPALAEDPALPPEELKIGGATIAVTYAPGKFDLPPAALHAWIAHAAEAVSAYYGRFPVPEVRLRVNPADGRSGLFNGTTWGKPYGAYTRISVGAQTTVEELDHDWMLTHEFVHTGFPSVEDNHHWIEEGIATYVEPIARVQVANMAAQRIWGDMMRDMGQGEPQAGDEGLDHTHTWGRTYWGGALFCLAADVRIHEQTKNRKGLQDALRAIVAAGGTISVDWPLERALKTGDAATGAGVLIDLYNEMKDKPAAVDLPDLWKRLGIERSGGTVVFHDDAPLSATRKAITAPRP